MLNKLVIGLIFLLSCQTRQTDKKPPTKELLEGDSITQQHREAMAKEEKDKVEQGRYKTYWGYRFHIKGDFNGDGKEETLTEKLISTRTGKEIAKFCGPGASICSGSRKACSIVRTLPSVILRRHWIV